MINTFFGNTSPEFILFLYFFYLMAGDKYPEGIVPVRDPAVNRMLYANGCRETRPRESSGHW